MGRGLAGADSTTAHRQVPLGRVLCVRLRVTPGPPPMGEVPLYSGRRLREPHTPLHLSCPQKKIGHAKWKALLTRGFSKKQHNLNFHTLFDGPT